MYCVFQKYLCILLKMPCAEALQKLSTVYLGQSFTHLENWVKWKKPFWQKCLCILYKVIFFLWWMWNRMSRHLKNNIGMIKYVGTYNVAKILLHKVHIFFKKILYSLRVHTIWTANKWIHDMLQKSVAKKTAVREWCWVYIVDFLFKKLLVKTTVNLYTTHLYI